VTITIIGHAPAENVHDDLDRLSGYAFDVSIADNDNDRLGQQEPPD